MRQFRPSLRQYGITEQQWRILRALSTVDEIEVLELASVCFLLAPSLSRILKDLEERGLVRRKTSPVDQRRGLISISPLGLRLIEMAGEQSEVIYDEITRRFGRERLQSLYDLLAELEVELQEPVGMPEPPTFGPPEGIGTRRRRGRPRES